MRKEEKKKPSRGFGGAPDDESNDNTGDGQQHQQDANLLPRALLRGEAGTERLLTETSRETERESPPKDGGVIELAHSVTHGESDRPFFFTEPHALFSLSTYSPKQIRQHKGVLV